MMDICSQLTVLEAQETVGEYEEGDRYIYPGRKESGPQFIMDNGLPNACKMDVVQTVDLPEVMSREEAIGWAKENHEELGE